MGEVYRARDTKLNRDVAIKILLPDVANDPDRLARFSREAQVLASLNHPNIAHIHGLEEAGGVTALVLELVEGEDLAQRIARGPIVIAEVLPIAKQIAEALDAAHEQGVVHRDLKPANIKVRADGTVKVLDFGLAKAADPAGAPGVDVTSSPTFVARATQVGVILGSAAYMAPEQARGKPVDKRADIWAFGVVVYEMVTGRRAFEGDELSDVLAAVLRQDISWSALPAGTPLRLRRLLERCLDRDPKTRLRDIGEARIVIEGIIRGDDAPTASVASSWSPARKSIWAVGATAILTALVVGAVTWRLSQTVAAPVPLIRASLPLPAGMGSVPDSVAVSATHVAFVGGVLNGQLFVQDLAGTDARPLPGVVSTPQPPFFSPDGRWIAYFARNGRHLQKVAVTGGPASDICEVSGSNSGGDWGAPGIVFADRNRGLFLVSAEGGTARSVIEPDKSSVLFDPVWLPGRRTILYTEAGRVGTGTMDLTVAKVMALSLDAGARPVKVADGASARFVPPHGLVYVRDRTLVGIRFDPDTLKTSGGAETLQAGVSSFAVSPYGTLVFQSNSGEAQLTFVWTDRQGHVEPTGIPPQPYRYPRISPDGTRIVLVSNADERDLWVWDLRQKVLTRLTTEKGLDSYPVWTPDGRRVIYGAEVRGGDENLAMRSADGTGEVEVLLKSDRHQTPYTISPDGNWAVFRDEVPGEGTNLDILNMRTREVKPLIATTFNEQNAEISPDGHWLAYQSNETGAMQVYVRPFPNVEGGKKQVSNSGGVRPAWSHDGHRLFYQTRALPPATMNVVERKSQTALEFGPAEVVLDMAPYAANTLLGRTYDVAADGRFLFPKRTDSVPDASGLTLVLNWGQHLAANR
jgi:serine/threonine-protein kinase